MDAINVPVRTLVDLTGAQSLDDTGINPQQDLQVQQLQLKMLEVENRKQ